MDPISPEELLSQLVEKVDLFAADPSEQEAWARANDYPAEEIALQFYDAMGTFLARLREHRLIDAADVAALEELKDYVSGVQSNLFADGSHVIDASEWKRVRELAATAASLRRPPARKHA